MTQTATYYHTREHFTPSTSVKYELSVHTCCSCLDSCETSPRVYHRHRYTKVTNLTEGEASCHCQLVAGQGGVKVMDPLVEGEGLDPVLA